MPHSTLHQLTSRLHKDNRRITEPRQIIPGLLRPQAHPQPIRKIHSALPDPCDLATVYRPTNMLKSMAMVKRSNFGTGLQDLCWLVEIDECFPTALKKKIAQQNGFTRITHKLEFFGACLECQ